MSVALAAAAVGAFVWLWIDSTSAPDGPAASDPSASSPRPVVPSDQALTPGTDPRAAGQAGAARRVPARAKARAPEARVAGRRVWVAPSVPAEARLREVALGLPAEIDLTQAYPVLRAGDLTAAVVAMAVTDDTASIRRLLVLGETGQVFEVPSLAWGQQSVSSAVLNARGTRLRLGVPDGSLVLDLLLLRADRSSREPAASPAVSPSTPDLRVRLWSGPGKRSTFAPRVARVATRLDVGPDRGDDTQAVLVDGDRPAMLVLGGGRRASYCCAVAGWVAPDEVLVESRSETRMRLLAWNVATSRVDRVSTIAPVVGNDWYLATSYARLTG